MIEELSKKLDAYKQIKDEEEYRKKVDTENRINTACEKIKALIPRFEKLFEVLNKTKECGLGEYCGIVRDATDRLYRTDPVYRWSTCYDSYKHNLYFAYECSDPRKPENSYSAYVYPNGEIEVAWQLGDIPKTKWMPEWLEHFVNNFEHYEQNIYLYIDYVVSGILEDNEDGEN